MKDKIQNTILRIAVEYLVLCFGAAAAAFSLEQILIPSQIMDGGMVGIAMIISAKTPLPLSALTLAFNLPLVFIGGKKLERSFIFRSLTAMAVFSGALTLFSRMENTVTQDKLLATVFGGVLLGFGVGLVLLSGGCLDGTEALAIMLSRKINISVGQFVLFLNVLIYLTAGALFGLDRALYSLMTYFIVSKVEDLINTGMQQGKAVMIITDHGKEIAADIYRSLGRTVTLIPGSGLISGEKTVLYCVVTRLELSALRRLVGREDYKAFMTVSDVSEIVGSHIKSTSAIQPPEPPALPDDADMITVESGDGT